MNQSQIAIYRGTCDASAAVRIGESNFFVTASDEDYILRVYDDRAPGRFVTSLDLTDFLSPVNRKKEPDIEGAAQIGAHIFWIGSHGRDKNGVVQESRHRLFATSVAIAAGSVTIEPFGVPYTRLLDDLVQSEALSALGLKEGSVLAPEAPGGLSIEGLAPTDDGQLLIGFRNPIPDGKALLVRLQNAADLIQGRADAAVLSVAGLLDLEGRGIRALEYLPAARSYIVIAGAFDDTRDFRVYHWPGGIDEPRPIDIPNLNDLNPEELIAIPKGDVEYELELFSDDGDAVVGDTKCKKLEDADARSFRARKFLVTLEIA